jgi:MFS family permease
VKKAILFPIASHFLFHFYEIAFPALAIPLTLSLGMSLKDVLALGFPMYVAFGIFSLPWGLFADRFTNHLTLMIGFFGCAAGSFLAATSSTPTGIMWSLALIGTFCCICHPAGMGLISHGGESRGSALGVYSVAGTVGLIVGPFLVGILNWLAGWKLAYAAMGVVSLSCGVAMLFFRIDESHISKKPTELNSEGNDKGFTWGSVILFFWVVTLGGLVYRINIVALPAYLEMKAGLLARYFHEMLSIPTMAATTTMAAATLTSLIYVAGIFGQVWGGKIADRHELKRLWFFFYGITMPLALLLAFLSDQWLVAAAAAYVFFCAGHPAHRKQPDRRVHAAAVAKHRLWLGSILIFGVGALAVYLVGWVSAHWSLGIVYLCSSGLVVLILIHIAFLFRLTRGRDLRNRDDI